MKVNVEELNSVQRKMTVEVSSKEVNRTLDGVYRQIQKNARLKGFRPGKTPRPVLERYYGPQATIEAAESMVKDTYPAAVDESGLAPVAQPEFDFEGLEKDKDFVYTVVFDVAPQFDLEKSAYEGLEIKLPRFEVSEEEVNKRLEMLRDRHAMLTPIEDPRPAQIGDVVVVNYQSFDGETPVEGGSADNVEVELGKGQVQEEIEVALVQTKPGDIVEATVHYDANAGNEAVRDKDIRFRLVVKEQKAKILPDLDDDFARGVSPEFESLESLKERLRADMKEMFEEQREQEFRRQVFDHIGGLGEFDVPASLVKEEKIGMVESFKNRMRQQGIDPDALGMDEAKMAEGFTAQAEKKVRAGIVLGKISDLENIEVGDEDMDAEFEKLSQKVGQPAAALKEIYKKNNMMSDMTARVMEDKTLRAIKASANIKDVDPSELAPKTAEEETEETAE